MARMIAEVYRAFRTANVPEEQAEAAAKAVVETDRDIADMRTELSDVKGDVRLLKWMVGFVLALQVLTFGKLFLP